MVARKPEGEFLSSVAGEFPEVIYIAGNHEYYGGVWEDTQEFLHNLTVVRFMDGELCHISGVEIFAGTLWTDCERGHPITIRNIQHGLNDYRRILQADGLPITPATTIAEHERTLDTLATCRPMVVITHHAPSFRSVNPEHAGSELNGAYCSDLEHIILSRPEIRLWIHGHTHGTTDYVIGQCRVMSNARGYSRWANAHPENPLFNPNMTVEI